MVLLLLAEAEAAGAPPGPRLLQLKDRSACACLRCVMF